MKSLLLKRLWNSKQGTFGVLIDKDPFAVILEPIIPVPRGTYIYKLYDSPRFKRKVYMTLQVPGHTYIEIHTGNVVEDTAGCQVIGLGFGDSGFGFGIKGGMSLPAFSDFMDRMNGEDLTLTIKEDL